MAYPALWALEEALERSDHQDANRERLKRDDEVLRGHAFVRNQLWFTAVERAAEQLEHPEWIREARKELATLYPRSSAARDLAWSEREKTSPTATDLAVARQWPGSLEISYFAFLTVIGDRP